IPLRCALPIWIAGAQRLYLLRCGLSPLPFAHGRDQLARDGDRRTRGEALEDGGVRMVEVHDRLDIAQRRSIVKGEELVVSECFDPAFDSHLFPDLGTVKELFYASMFHVRIIW